MKTSEFDYDLPPDLIAQHPPPERTDARMMIVRRGSQTITHGKVTDLPRILESGDLLVVNDTKVIPSRLYGTKIRSGGRVEVLLLEEMSPGMWKAMCRMSGRVRPGISLDVAQGMVTATVVSVGDAGEVVLDVKSHGDLQEVLENHGMLPLPPYIKRPGGPIPEDRIRYQTVYANKPGAVAAPTAGLHFTPRIFAELESRGMSRVSVTLHVGAGTFKPVKSDEVDDHVMESERYSIPGETAAAIRKTRDRGGRVIGVGTTTVRALESGFLSHGGIVECSGRTSLFIKEPFQFRVVDAILTNFHLPRSTLLMMISAFAGRDLVRRAYSEAVCEKYRFYSYGDCMLVL